jgi:hypothetical protein
MTYRRMTKEQKREARRLAEEMFPEESMGEAARDACIAEQLGIESYEYLEDLAEEAREANGSRIAYNRPTPYRLYEIYCWYEGDPMTFNVQSTRGIIGELLAEITALGGRPGRPR